MQPQQPFFGFFSGLDLFFGLGGLNSFDGFDGLCGPSVTLFCDILTMLDRTANCCYQLFFVV
jgi:hypothetical protein